MDPQKHQPLETALVHVRLKGLDEHPGLFCMSFGFDPEPLVRSIRDIGLVNAPCVVQNPQGHLDIVIGYRRLVAAKALGWPVLYCRDLTPLGFSPLQLLLLNLKDNLATRTLNPVEMGMVLSRLITHLPREEVVHAYMPMLHLPSHDPTLDLYMEIERSDPEIRAAVAGGDLSLGAVRVLFSLEEDARRVVFEWLSKLMLNSNQQTQFIEMLMDISSIEGKNIRTILMEEGLLDTLVQGKSPNRPQKAKQVLDRLRQRRFPRLFGAERRFQKVVATLPLPGGVRIVHPPYFEGSQYRLEALFRDGQELRRLVKQLLRVKDLEKIRDPWGPEE